MTEARPFTDTPAPEPRRAGAAGAAALALLGLWAAVTDDLGTWLLTDAAGASTRYDAADLRILTVALALAAAFVLACCVAALVRSDPRIVGLATVVALGAAVLAGAFIAVAEILTSLIPADLVPATFRRFTAGVTAGSGAWLYLAAVGGAAVALRATPTRLPRAIRQVRADPVTSAAACGLLAVAVAVAWTRYEPWIEGGALGGTVRAAGWALPWAGPLSLVGLWLMVGALVLTALDRTVAAALLAGLGGWLVSFPAALTVLAVDTADRVPIPAVVPAQLDDADVGLAAAPGAWIAFVCGLLAATAGAVFLRTPRIEPGRGDPWMS